MVYARRSYRRDVGCDATHRERIGDMRRGLFVIYGIIFLFHHFHSAPDNAADLPWASRVLRQPPARGLPKIAHHAGDLALPQPEARPGAELKRPPGVHCESEFVTHKSRRFSASMASKQLRVGNSISEKYPRRPRDRRRDPVQRIAQASHRRSHF